MSDEQQPPITGDSTGAPTAPNGGGERKLNLTDVIAQHGLQAEYEAVLKDRLERQKAQFKAAQDKAAEDAKAATLKEQGEFKALYEAEQARAADLAAKADAAARYEAALTRHLKALREGLPEHILMLLDAKDPAAQLEFLSEHGDKIRPAPTPEPTPPPRGTPRAPAPPTTRSTTPEAPARPAAPLIKF